jgi:hypothetical protein
VFLNRRRELRLPFVAATTFTDIQVSDRVVSAETTDLSVHGCFVATPTPRKLESKLWITIAFAGVKIAAMAKVAHVNQKGMGIAFTNIEMREQLNVDRWMNSLRSHASH